METYKVWVTIKDRYGNIKEVDGGNISIKTNIDAFSKETLDLIEKSLPLDDYIKRANLATELDAYATDEEVAQETQKVVTIVEEKVTETVEEVAAAVEEKETIRYSDFELRAD